MQIAIISAVKQLYRKLAFKYPFVILLVFIGTVYLQSITAQEINKEVYVIRPYEPTLSDANKYSFMPEMEEIKSEPPQVNYSINPVRIENTFVPEPIKAARTVTTSIPKIYNSWLKLGMGNYTTPLVEFNISNLHSRDLSYGAYLFHKSSNGKIVLPNDDKVHARYAINNINLYGNKFYRNSTLKGNIRYSGHSVDYYGYNALLYDDPSLVEINSDSVKQRISIVGMDMGVRSSHSDSAKLNYHIEGTFDYLFDKFDNIETGLIISTGLSKSFNGLMGGVDVSLDYSKLSGTDTATNTLFSLGPWISKRSKDWKFLLGFNAVSDMADISHFYIYPTARLDIIVVEDVLIPFIGLTGQLQKNNYRNITSENPWVKPGLILKNSSTNIKAYGGIKGNISSAITFRGDVSYAVIKNAHLYVNDTLRWQNMMNAVYDDIDLITYHGQLIIQPVRNLKISIDGKYYDYEVYEQMKPWHQPDFEINSEIDYNITPKLNAKAGIGVTGNRWAWDYLQPDIPIKIRPAADINIHLTYAYSKVLTIFADIYNLADRSFLIWNQYPSQRFNFLMGLSYKL